MIEAGKADLNHVLPDELPKIILKELLWLACISTLADQQIITLIFLFCGGYRSRTDDPLRARQML